MSTDDEVVAWGELLRQTAERLGRAGVPDPDTEARRLVERASGAEGAELVVALREPATIRAVAHLDAMVERRSGGEPLQYVVGSWGFRSLDLFVDGRVLIPRPETEVVVDVALGEIDRRPDDARRPAVVADLGTGSGAIAAALAFERSDVDVWATDASADALLVAGANLAGLGRAASRVHLAEGSWFAALPPELRGRLDLVVSNPPYVADHEPLPPEVERYEPRRALRAGRRGTEALEAILGEVGEWLAPDGSAVLELAPHQADEMANLARRRGLVDVDVVADLAGRPRVLLGRSSGVRP
jgi:release factor glutamine methyltransferase